MSLFYKVADSVTHIFNPRTPSIGDARSVFDLPVPDLSQCPTSFAKIVAALLEKSPQGFAELQHRTKLSPGEICDTLRDVSDRFGSQFVLHDLARNYESPLGQAFVSGSIPEEHSFNTLAFAPGIEESREGLREILDYTGLRAEHIHPR